MKYIFDIDGTLTPSRGIMNEEFKEFCMDFFDKKEVYLITGSDRSKTIEQIGEDLYNKAKIVYNCSGNDIYVAESNIHKTDWKLDNSISFWLRNALEKSSYHTKTGNHIEHRTGLVNFSIVGRNATQEQREAYYKYDCSNHERATIAQELNKKFGKKINATVAGETGIDIVKPGSDKSQVVPDFDGQDIVFFGDKTEEGGNDYTIAEAFKGRKQTVVISSQLQEDAEVTQAIVPVKNWEETWEVLKIIA